MDIVIALLPALLWGCTPLWVHFLGGKPIQQLIGTTYGALIVGIVIYLIKRPEITVTDFLWCLLGGACWSLGQLAQYRAYGKLSVSTTSPITAGIQLVGVNVVGVLCFGSWASPSAKVIGFSAVALIIIGVFISSRTGKKDQSAADKRTFIKNVIQLILGTGIGYTACSTLPRIPHAQGWVTFPPQSIGMLLGAVLLSFCFKEYRQQKPLLSRDTFKNIFEGFNSGLGTFFYLVAMMLNGVSTAFTLSQMTPVIATFGGLVILHEHKRGKALTCTLIGLVAIVIGGIMTSFIK